MAFSLIKQAINKIIIRPKAFNNITQCPSKHFDSIDLKIIEAYNETRVDTDKDLLCYAPFKNIYFNIVGNAAPCWLSFKDSDYYRGKSISEIWFGKKFEQIRHNISRNDLSGKCSLCEHYIKSGNYITPLAKAYDNQYKPGKYPVMLELELANTCNLECVMCNGILSSSISKNRRNITPFQAPYDDTFVEQLLEYIPHLEEIRFNGGEPFLNDIYYKIWEKVLIIKPGIKIVIATNGTVLNEKVKNILERGHFDINLSLDSLIKEIYENIRINANFEKTISNLDYFQDYCLRKKSTLCILTNPMPQNWHELPEFIHFCNERNLPIWFNTIQSPFKHALWPLSSDKLNEIYTTLSNYSFTGNEIKAHSFHNIEVYHNLVHQQIKTWMDEALEREKNKSNGLVTEVNSDKDPDNPEKYFYSEFQNLLEKKATGGELSVLEMEHYSQKLRRMIDTLSLNTPKSELFSLMSNYPVETVVDAIISEDETVLIEIAKRMW